MDVAERRSTAAAEERFMPCALRVDVASPEIRRRRLAHVSVRYGGSAAGDGWGRLQAALSSADATDEVSVVLVTITGAAPDTYSRAAGAGPARPPSSFPNLELRRPVKPLVVAVDADCELHLTGLVAAADIALASTGARFSVPAELADRSGASSARRPAHRLVASGAAERLGLVAEVIAPETLVRVGAEIAAGRAEREEACGKNDVGYTAPWSTLLSDLIVSSKRHQVGRALDPTSDPVVEDRDRWVELGWDGIITRAAFMSLLRAHQAAISRVHRILRSFDLSITDQSALLFIAMAPDRAEPMASIARRLMIGQGRCSYVIDRLERRGLVRRQPHPTDGRTTLAVLTQEGIDMAVRTNETLCAERYGFGSVSDEVLDELVAVLSRVRDEIEDR